MQAHGLTTFLLNHLKQVRKGQRGPAGSFLDSLECASGISSWSFLSPSSSRVCSRQFWQLVAVQFDDMFSCLKGKPSLSQFFFGWLQQIIFSRKAPLSSRLACATSSEGKPTLLEKERFMRPIPGLWTLNKLKGRAYNVLNQFWRYFEGPKTTTQEQQTRCPSCLTMKLLKAS